MDAFKHSLVFIGTGGAGCGKFFCAVVVAENFRYGEFTVIEVFSVHGNVHGYDFYIIFIDKIFRHITA